MTESQLNLSERRRYSIISPWACYRPALPNNIRTHHSPPKRVGEALEIVVDVLLHQEDEEGGEDEAQEADVNRRYQLLRKRKQKVSKVSKLFR